MSEINTEVAVEPVTSTEPEVVETEGATDEPSAEATEAPAEPEKKSERTFSQDEVSRLIAKETAKEARRLKKQVELEVENRLLKEKFQPVPAQQTIGPPRQDQFNTYEEYLDARTEYLVELKSQQREQERLHALAQEQHQKQQQVWKSRAETAADKYDDFDDVIEEATNSVVLKQAAMQALFESDMGPELLYYLHKHPEEQKAIYGMSSTNSVKALGRLEEKLSSKPAKVITPSSAPEPITPVNSAKSNTKSLDDPNLTDAEFARIRRNQIAQRRR